MNCSVYLIDKKNNNIRITDNSLENANKLEYRLRQNLFDPSKSSPPNNFMEKLQKRMSIYTKKPSVASCS
jgi:hypothetical protein